MNRSDVLFVGTFLIDVSLLVVAMACLRQRLFKSVVFLLLIYSVISLYRDCIVGIIKLDRALKWGGAATHQVLSIANITFTLDAIARVAVFIGICLCIVTLQRMKESAGSIGPEAKHVR